MRREQIKPYKTWIKKGCFLTGFFLSSLTIVQIKLADQELDILCATCVKEGWLGRRSYHFHTMIGSTHNHWIISTQ